MSISSYFTSVRLNSEEQSRGSVMNNNKQEERIEMLQSSEHNREPIRYERSISYRTHGCPRFQRIKRKAINPSSLESLRVCDANNTDTVDNRDTVYNTKETLVENLIHAIKQRDGSLSQELIKNNDMSTLFKLRFQITIRVRRSDHAYLKTGVYVPSTPLTVAMEVTLLQLAVGLEMDDIVQVILESVMQGELNPSTALNNAIFKSETSVHFEGDSTKYRDVDQMLNKATAFQLAAFLHTNSLKLFIAFTKAHGIELRDFMRNGESPFNSSAIHFAACNPDSECMRYV